MALASWCLAIPYFLYAFVLGIQLQVICASVAFCIVLNYFTWCVLSMYANFMFCYCCLFPFFRKWWKLELLCQLLTSRIRFYIYSKRMMWLWLVEKLDAGKQHRYLVVQFYKKMLSQFCRYSVIAICPIQWVVSPAFYMSIIDTIVFTLASSIFCLSFEEVWSVCAYIYSLKKKPRDFIYALIIIALVWYTLFNYPCVTFIAECGFLMLVKSYLIWSRSTYKENKFFTIM